MQARRQGFKRNLLYIFSTFVTILSVGCFPTPPAPAAPRTAMQVQAPVARTWEKAVEILADKNIQIKTLDRSSGLIVAEPQPVVSDSTGLQLADCGLDEMRVPKIATSATWNLLVRGDSARSTVKANIRFVRLRSTRGILGTSNQNTADECSTRGVWETEFEQLVKAAAERP